VKYYLTFISYNKMGQFFSDISQDPNICVIQQSQTTSRSTANPNVLIASPWPSTTPKPEIPQPPTPVLDLTELF